MNRSTRLCTVLAAVLVALATALLAPSAPATAGDFPGAGSDDGETGLAGSCVATAGPNYLGLACPGGSADTGTVRYPPYFLCPGKPTAKKPPKDFKTTCQKPPRCWNSDKLTADELKAANVENTPGPGGITYYWNRCLRGVGNDLVASGATVIQKPYPRPNSSLDELKVITPEQNELAGYYFNPESGGQRPPDPLVGTSPNPSPRVRTDVSFYDENTTGTVVSVTAAGVTLTAVEDSMVVDTPSGDAVRCTREGADSPDAPGYRKDAAVGYVAQDGETRATAGGKGCWYYFERSSADQEGETYQVPATSHWTVWQQVDGGPATRFRSLAGNAVEFDKDGFAPVVVSEVQSINVPFTDGAQ